MEIERFYELKKDGVKYRPIGSPSLDSRVISRSLNDLIYLIYWDDFDEFQHGFRPNRGTHTITAKLWEEIVMKGRRDIYEFYLKGFFNQVRVQ